MILKNIVYATQVDVLNLHNFIAVILAICRSGSPTLLFSGATFCVHCKSLVM